MALPRVVRAANFSEQVDLIKEIFSENEFEQFQILLKRLIRSVQEGAQPDIKSPYPDTPNVFWNWVRTEDLLVTYRTREVEVAATRSKFARFKNWASQLVNKEKSRPSTVIELIVLLDVTLDPPRG